MLCSVFHPLLAMCTGHCSAMETTITWCVSAFQSDSACASVVRISSLNKEPIAVLCGSNQEAFFRSGKPTAQSAWPHHLGQLWKLSSKEPLIVGNTGGYTTCSSHSVWPSLDHQREALCSHLTTVKYAKHCLWI